jgi:nicotinamidase/pyrazinamidase
MQPTATDALIVVDVQNDFVTGSLAIPDAKAIIEPINRLATIVPNVIITTDWHPVGHVSLVSSHPGRQHWDVVPVFYGEQRIYRDHCVQGTWGAELDPELKLGMAQLIFRKGFKLGVESNGAFYENDGTPTGLGAYLKVRGIKRVFCTGLARFGCVMQTSLGAARDGFQVYMVDDASKGGAETDALLREFADAGIEWVQSRDIAA